VVPNGGGVHVKNISLWRIVTLVVLLNCPAFAFGDNAGVADVAGKAGFLRGKASVFGADGKTRELVRDGTVSPGEKIVTGEDAKIRIEFTDGTELWLGENSELTVDQYVFAEGGKDREKVSMWLRFAKGTCRMITGAITKINPDRVKVKTRVATVGVRGCDVGISGSGGINEVYVLGLGKGESVVVETTSKGVPILDVATGQPVMFDKTLGTVIDVPHSGTRVTIVENKGVVEERLTKEQMAGFLSAVSHLPAAEYDMIQDNDGATLILKPGSQKPELPAKASGRE